MEEKEIPAQDLEKRVQKLADRAAGRWQIFSKKIMIDSMVPLKEGCGEKKVAL